MTFFTQSRTPRFWKILQYYAGGTVDKRKLATSKYEKQRNILEVGCSLGNIAEVFKKIPGIKYTGIDIDPVVISYAQKDYASFTNFRFLCIKLDNFARQVDEQFDYVLFAGIFHHIDHDTIQSLFESARVIMSDDGILVVVDPLLPRKDDSWFLHLFLKVDRGEYIRNESEMRSILQNIRGFELKSAETCIVRATPFSFPKCARFGVYELSKI